MLSGENPQAPPCSSKISELKADEKGSAEKFSFKEAADAVLAAVPGDEIKHQPPFSIRDYVWTKRSNEMETNWPFSPNLLQECLKHGIKDLLPPFEHPSVMRTQYLRKGLGSNRRIAFVNSSEASQEIDMVKKEDVDMVDLKPNGFNGILCSSCQRVVGSSDCSHSPLAEVCILPKERRDGKLCRISTPLFSNMAGVVNHEIIPKTSSEHKALGAPNLSDETEVMREASGKCSLDKFCGQLYSVREKRNVLNSVALAESMPSEIYPVCRKLASYSRNTLNNANIDLCFPVDSASKLVITTQKMKSKKIKLMPGIYLTDPSSSLKGPEIRIHKNMVVDSKFPIQNCEGHAVNSRQQLMKVNSSDDGEESSIVNDLYGVEHKKLSKLRDASALSGLEDCKIMRNMKEISENQSYVVSRKKHHSLDDANVHPQSKKLRKIMLPEGKLLSSFVKDLVKNV